MKSKVLLYIIVLSGCLYACQKEDALTPSHTPDSFAPLPGATDEESKLREEFYKNTGCFLLFNDTLRHEYKGVDGYGNPWYETELVGLEYVLTGVVYYRYQFDYLQTLEQKRQVADFLCRYFVPNAKGMLPYSIMATSGIDEYYYTDGDYTYNASPLSFSNMRCLALNISKLWELTDEKQKKSYGQDICCDLILATWVNPDYWGWGSKYEGSPAEKFFKLGTYYYDQPKTDYYGDRLDPLEYGFLEDPYEEVFPSEDEDARAYIKACASMTEEEFFAKYGANDWQEYTRQKYNIMKPLIDAMGIKFN